MAKIKIKKIEILAPIEEISELTEFLQQKGVVDAEAKAPVPTLRQTPIQTPADPEVPASGWLGPGEGTFSNSAADAGWAAAEKVAKHVETERTRAGLPQRRPGQRLVPGAVAQTRSLPPRDPEAIRRRLASHAAGVSRGRTATVNPTNRAQEEGQA